MTHELTLATETMGTTPSETAERMAASWMETRLAAIEFNRVLDDGELDSAYEALVDQLAGENTSGRLMDDDQLSEAVMDRIFTSLPDDETRELLHNLREHDEERENIRTDAAFLFGLALGRQLGGVL